MAVLLGGLSVPAYAQQNCGPRDKIVAVLTGNLFLEDRIALGISADETVLTELFVNLQTSTWSVLTTNGQVSCITSSGEDFVFDTPEVPGAGS